jgi:hypothetical protein
LGNGSFVLNPHGELFGNRYRAKHKESERPNTNKGNVMRKRCLWPRCYCWRFFQFWKKFPQQIRVKDPIFTALVFFLPV